MPLEYTDEQATVTHLSPIIACVVFVLPCCGLAITTAHLEKDEKGLEKHPNDTACMWRKVLGSDETKIELFGVNSSRYI